MKSSYPRNISIIAAVFIFLILFLALINLYISLQFRNEFLNYDKNRVVAIATLSSHYLMGYSNQTELYALFKNLTNAFELDHLIVADTLGSRIYDSWMLPLEYSFSMDRLDFTDDYQRLPSPGDIVQVRNSFLYRNQDPPFYLSVSMVSPYVLTFDVIVRWHIFYITISLIFIGFLGVFLIRNLFLPMRYVTNLAQDMGIEMKKEDFVSVTFDEIFKKIKAREEALIEFSSYIAHEFRNSIGAISGLARLVEKGKKPASDIVTECQSMDELITKLLEYSRPLKAATDSVDAVQLIRDALERVAIPKRIEVHEKMKDEKLRFVGDYDLVLIALTNVLKNSIEAIQNKHGLITVEAGEVNGFVFISVADSGPGIEESELETIFHPFYSRKEGGMGLGLAYVKKIMEIHNGRVDVQSAKGHGSTFTLKFPLRGKLH